MRARAIAGTLGLTLVLGAVPAVGRAATVEVATLAGSETVSYTAGPGERNDLTFTDIQDSWPSAFLVTDPGAIIAPGEGCVSVNPHRAVCIAHSGAMYHLAARLGDGDDVLEPAGFDLVTADGGPGDDALMGGTWDDHLDGGGGRDALHGGPGDDTLLDGDRDGSAGPPRDSDILDGGDGFDTVSYAQRTTSVSVDLSDGLPDGAPGEGDVLTEIESIHGGHGDDRLTGDDGPNRFADEGGDNRMTGQAGDDVFTGASTGAVECGGGMDTVHGVTRRSRLAQDCEAVWHPWADSGFWIHANPRPTRRGMTFSMTCDTDDGEPETCSGTVSVVAGSRTIARGVLPPGVRRRTARLVLTPAGTRLLHRRATAATVVLRGTQLPDMAWGIVLSRR